MKRKIILLAFIGLISMMLQGTSNKVEKTKITNTNQITSVEKIDFRNYKLNQVEELIKVEIENIKRIEEERLIQEEVKRKEEIEARKKHFKFEVSFYCSCYSCTQNGNGITASGEYATEGITIAAPEEIPFGSEIHIEGLGSYKVQDRGGFIDTIRFNTGEVVTRVDVFVSSHSRAIELGRYYSEGYIIINE